MEAMKIASPEAEEMKRSVEQKLAEIKDHHSSILQQVLLPPPTLDFVCMIL
jgi:hypothetical protein